MKMSKIFKRRYVTYVISGFFLIQHVEYHTNKKYTSSYLFIQHARCIDHVQWFVNSTTLNKSIHLLSLSLFNLIIQYPFYF